MTQKFIIGDVVMYGNNIMIIKEPREEGHFDLLWNNWIIYCYINIEEIKPVPLTPDILEKNGWKSINGKYALKIKNANYVVLEFTEDGIYVYINEKTILFTIKYIHELQHILFGLGLNSEMEV